MKKRKLIALGSWLVFISVASCHALTLTEIRTEIRRLISDTASSSSLQRYSDTVLNSFINEAQRDIVNQTWCLHTTTGITLVANTTYYSLPSNLLNIQQVHLRDGRGISRDLEEVSYRVLNQRNPDYARQSGAPSQYVVRYSTYGENPLEIGVLPVPTSTSTGTLIVDYFNQVTDLSIDADVPFDGFLHIYPYHYTIVYQVAAKIAAIDGMGGDVTLYTQMFINYLGTMKDRLGEKSNYNPGSSAVAAPPR